MYVFLKPCVSPKITFKDLLQCGPPHWQELRWFACGSLALAKELI